LAQPHRDLIISLAARHKLPAVYFERAFVVAGGLIRCRPRKQFRSPSARFFHAGEDADNESGVIAERRRWRGVILSPAGPVHNTKLMVLLLLTFGQFLIVALTAFVLWLAGQYGDPPNWRWLRSLRKLRSFGR
jgi:hypothetical protein